MVTVDTNVLVYIYDDDEAVKQATALRLFDRLTLTNSPIALQAIGELQNALRRKLRRPVWEAAHAARTVMAAFRATFPPTERAVEDALGYAAAGHLSYWDALILGSARDAGCDVMLSEDMGGRERELSVLVINPFEPTGALPDAVRALLEP